jgi:hypothetical protein
MEQTNYQYDGRIVGRKKSAKPFDGNDLHLHLMPFRYVPLFLHEGTNNKTATIRVDNAHRTQPVRCG